MVWRASCLFESQLDHGHKRKRIFASRGTVSDRNYPHVATDTDPTNSGVIAKLLIFSAAMIILPIAAYYLSLEYLFQGKISSFSLERRDLTLPHRLQDHLRGDRGGSDGKHRADRVRGCGVPRRRHGAQDDGDQTDGEEAAIEPSPQSPGLAIDVGRSRACSRSFCPRHCTGMVSVSFLSMYRMCKYQSRLYCFFSFVDTRLIEMATTTVAPSASPTSFSNTRREVPGLVGLMQH